MHPLLQTSVLGWPRAPRPPPVLSTQHSTPRPRPACRLQGISDADVGTLQGVLDDAVQENLGMAMIYTLISLAQEWITVGAAAGRRAVRDGSRKRVTWSGRLAANAEAARCVS